MTCIFFKTIIELNKRQNPVCILLVCKHLQTKYSVWINDIDMKFFNFFLIFFYIGFIVNCQEWINMKFKGVKCRILAPSYGVLNKCYVKPISRNVSTLNIDFDILKVVRGPIMIEALIFLRYGAISRQIYPKITLDFCAIMRGDGAIEKLALFIISFFRDSVPQLFHKCPFTGPLKLYNITLNVTSLPLDKLLPTGLYRTIIGISHNKTKVASLDILVEIASRLDRF